VLSGWTIGTDAWIWMGAWALVMVLVVWLLVREPRHASHDDPGTILRDRFARGEISEAEFGQAMAALDADPPTTAKNSDHHATRHAPHGQEARHD
jgi:hypothetical protein